MRKLIASFFMSADGVVDKPQDWHFPYFDDEMGAVVGGTLANAGALLLGRRTYDEWVQYWPTESGRANPMGEMINSLPKYVVSTTLDRPGWENTTVIKDDLAGDVKRLKAQDGGHVNVSGSGELVRSLLAEGLVDELNLLVHPIVVGKGAHLFEDGPAPEPLALARSTVLGSGVLHLVYRPA
jgi:dihydrofolate reductase